MWDDIVAAATMSSHITPKPPLILASKYLMGGGLAISNRRNRPKASNCAKKVSGDSHSTSQNATISSQTIPTWSSTCNSRATLWQAQQPYAKRSEEKTSELQYLMLNSNAIFCLKKKK